MISKKPGRRAGTVRVKFSMPTRGAKSIYVAGEFSDWRPEHAMRRRPDGTWDVTVDLNAGRTYEFRYVVDGREWVNDPAPDGYAPNPYGGENSVVTT